jgi:hypothetical protein
VYSTCKKSGIEATENWHSHIPKSVTEHEDITVLWNQGIQTNGEVLANRPDIMVKTIRTNLANVQYEMLCHVAVITGATEILSKILGNI